MALHQLHRCIHRDCRDIVRCEGNAGKSAGITSENSFRIALIVGRSLVNGPPTCGLSCLMEETGIFPRGVHVGTWVAVQVVNRNYWSCRSTLPNRNLLQFVA